MDSRGHCQLLKLGALCGLGSCSREDCARCGWYTAEAARRRASIRDGGLQYQEDGLRCLVLPKRSQARKRK